MAEPTLTLADKIDRAVQRVTPFAYRMQRITLRLERWSLHQYPRSACRRQRDGNRGHKRAECLLYVIFTPQCG